MPVLLAGGLFLLGTRHRDSTVPDLRGLTVREAAAVAKKAHLGLLEQGKTTSPPLDLTITGQRPDPGATARRGSLVTLTVRRPVASVTVPDLTGLSLEQARAGLASVGLRLGSIERGQGVGTAAGAVTRQSAPPGSAADQGATVDVWVTDQDAPRVPSLVGMTREQASAAASNAGLALEVSEEPAEGLPPGRVIRQSPTPGAALSGGRVAIVISAAVEPQTSSAAPPARVYTALAGGASFPVLYPATLPSGLQLDAGGTNPRMVNDPAGASGFELRYLDPARPAVHLSLLEGSWFDPAIDSPTTATVRGRTGSLGTYPGGLLLTWEESGTAYAVSAVGLTRDELLAFASALTVAQAGGQSGEVTLP